MSIRSRLARWVERRVAARRERWRLAHNRWAEMAGRPTIPMCPDGRPLEPRPWIERGWTDRHGVRWVTCPCGMAHSAGPSLS